MTGKLLTLSYLTSLVTTLWIAFKYELRLDNLLRVKKLLSILLAGYSMALTYIFIANYRGEKPLLFLAMLSFCPFVLLVIFLVFKKYEYQGDLSALIIAIILNSLGLIAIYRLDVNSGWGILKIFGFQEKVVSMSFKQLVFSMLSLFCVAHCISKGIFSSLIGRIEKDTGYLFWGVVAIALLMITKLAGGTLMSQDKSFQPTEFAFKLMFIFFISLYYKSRSSELALSCYPMKEVTKLVLFVFVSIALFFFVPFCFLQKELGSTLLIALTFIMLTTYVTNRISFFFAGIALIALAIFVGTLAADHVAKRIFITWLDWKEYAFTSYNAGTDPRYQIFMAIAAIKLSPWGVGLGNGILKHATMDKTIVPMAVNDFISIPIVSELGIVALLIIGGAFFVLLNKAIPKTDTLTFKAILAVGITIALTTQALYNLSSVIALLPPTGIPLPWISYGGSATLANYILIGILVVILNERENSREKK